MGNFDSSDRHDRLMWENCQEAACLHDGQGHALRVNPAWEKLDGEDHCWLMDRLSPAAGETASELSLLRRGDALCLVRRQRLDDRLFLLTVLDVSGLYDQDEAPPAMADSLSSTELGLLEEVLGPHAVTAGALLGDRPLGELDSEHFGKLLGAYGQLFARYMDEAVHRQDRGPLREAMRDFARTLTFLRARARDVVDIHRQVLEKVVRDVSPRRAAALVGEGRLLLIELLGMLTDHYRMYAPGPARRHRNGDAPRSGA